jgi:SAM-dependent methyltransferase
MKIEKVSLETNYPVAWDSPDHLMPWGTIHDSSRNIRFNHKLYRLFSALSRPLRVMDLGCSGGGFIRDCNNDGCVAVGLEGSNHSQHWSRAEWATLGGKLLYTCDIGKPFKVLFEADNQSKPALFDAVTSWEVLEHIRTEELTTVFKNVIQHLAPGGIVVFCISVEGDAPQGVELHQTIMPEAWWLTQLQSAGFRVRGDLNRYFNTQFVRGPRQYAPFSFTVVLDIESAPGPKACAGGGVKEMIMDAWHCSSAQRVLKRLVG